MVVEPELECDCSLTDVLLVLGVGVHLGFVHQAGDLAPSLFIYVYKYIICYSKIWWLP